MVLGAARPPEDLLRRKQRAEKGMIPYVLEWIGAAFVLATMWAALQFEGGPMEYRDEFGQATGRGGNPASIKAWHTISPSLGGRRGAPVRGRPLAL